MRRRLALACVIAVLAPAAADAAKKASVPAARPSAEQQKLQHAAQASRAKVAEVERQIAQLRAQLVQLGAVEATSERAAGDKRARLDALNAQDGELTAGIGRDQNAAARLLGALELYRRNPPPALLVYPGSAKDAVRAQILARAIAPELEARSKALTDQVEQTRRLRRVAEAASDDLLRSQSDLAEQRGRIEALIADKSALERGLHGDAQTAQIALRALADASAAPSALIGRLPPPSTADGPPPTGFVTPVQGRLLTRFGQTTDKGRSQGFSWRAAPGARVLAPVAGTVEYAGPLKAWGVVLILRTGGAYHLVLAGLQATSAVIGRPVAAGEPVGRMANDAGSSLDLYLEVRRNGEPVDPERWLKTAAR
jgi:septal ring factor EnvC (AmiA/AmiB activator)